MHLTLKGCVSNRFESGAYTLVFEHFESVWALPLSVISYFKDSFKTLIIQNVRMVSASGK
jgi:hypothetical protein